MITVPITVDLVKDKEHKLYFGQHVADFKDEGFKGSIMLSGGHVIVSVEDGPQYVLNLLQVVTAIQPK